MVDRDAERVTIGMAAPCQERGRRREVRMDSVEDLEGSQGLLKIISRIILDYLKDYLGLSKTIIVLF